MIYLLQKQSKLENDYDTDVMLLKNILKENKYIHEYMSTSLDEFFDNSTNSLLNKNSFPKYCQNAIPVGTLEFVGAWFKIFHNLDNMNPIEIPSILRTDEFLKRDYSIVTSDKLPRNGKWFIKDVSQLKVFSSALYDDVSLLHLDDILKSPEEIQNKSKLDTTLYLDNTHLYQVSERVNPLSEYRVYFISGELQSISHYNGDPYLLPDVNLISKANLLYSTQEDYPKSYTMDIMVTDRGTSVIEIHSFVSVGLYTTIWGSNLAYAYRDGIDYHLNYNTKLNCTK